MYHIKDSIHIPQLNFRLRTFLKTRDRYFKAPISRRTVNIDSTNFILHSWEVYYSD